MTRLTRRVRRALWGASGRLGWPVALPGSPPLTVLITYFHPARARHAEDQVRNALRCRFVGKVVAASHNPELRAETLVQAGDPRLVFVNASERRGSGYRWTVAETFDPEFLLAIDDDILLRASQIAGLYRHLLRRPEVVHGLSGIQRRDDGALDFMDRRNVEVDYLCEVYALTRQHLKRYGELRARVTDAPVAESLDSAFDFVVVSRAGRGRARIHDLGHILRCETFKTPGVALHKQGDFESKLVSVLRSLDNGNL